MPLPASGQITQMQINYVIRTDGLDPSRTNTSQGGFAAGSWERSLAGIPSGQIAFSNLYGTGGSTPPF